MEGLVIIGPSILNDLIINSNLITPNYSGQIEKDSIDLRINSICLHKGNSLLTIEARDIGKTELVELSDCEWTLEPNRFYIGQTMEQVSMPNNMAAIVLGRSTMFRAGCLVAGGYVDPGYIGNIHFGFLTPAGLPTVIEYAFPAIQLVFMDAESVASYDGAY